MTVQERLQTDFAYKAICKINLRGGQKEVVILREKHRAAVMPNFPCSLLNDNELLHIKFIRSGGNSGPVKMRKPVHSPENLVSFYIKTRGGDKIRMVMNNKELKSLVDQVCVYAVKGEKVKAALKRDGRFLRVIYSRGTLYEQGTMDTVNWSTLVDDLDGKLFEIIVSRYQMGSQESSQEMDQEFETVKDEKSEVPETPQATNTNQESNNAQEKKTETPVEEKEFRKYPATKEIPDTQEILNLLREQHGDLLKTLKEREKLKNDAAVKKFFRVEYDKSAQSFTEVKRVKQLMMLSDFVCQIRKGGSALGTGFLLFNRFILTNAHVVENHSAQILNDELTAVFRYEDMDSEVEKIPVKNIVALFYGKDGIGNYLDFALLELSGDVKLDFPGILESYTDPPTRGGVCIIGHPGGGVKQMDPCFIIAKGDRVQAAKEYYEKNKNLADEEMNKMLQEVIKNECLADDKEIRESQIIYHSCFFCGSSGSPVFNDDCKLIGVHTGGFPFNREGAKTRSVIEYALPIFPILLHIYNQCRNSGRADVVQYLDLQNFSQQANEQLQKNN